MIRALVCKLIAIKSPLMPLAMDAGPPPPLLGLLSMARQLLAYRCLIISPSDVDPERDAVEEAIHSWNAHAGTGFDILIEPIRWESHARPELGGSPQAQINRQLVEGCDFGVAVFWSRLGSPTAEHSSGSIEEIERLLASDKKVMVYFCSRPIPQERLKDDQFSMLAEAKKAFENRGLLASFDTVDSLRAMVGLHVNGLVNELALQKRAAGQPIPSTGTVTAPTPDIRITVRGVVVAGSRASAAIEIKVQNHSPSDFFMGSMTVTLEDLSSLAFSRDSVTRELLVAQRIEPGNSFSFCFDPAEIQATTGRTPTEMLSVLVTDKIGRTFRSKAGALPEAVVEWSQWIRVISEGSK